jgi:hypothetical protein
LSIITYNIWEPIVKLTVGERNHNIRGRDVHMKHNLSTNRMILTTLLLFLTLLLFGCKGSVKSPTRPPDKPPEWETPRENREAEEAALWLSDSLVAPEWLYNAILNDLAAIRAEYRDSIPQVNITFIPPWVSGKIWVSVTDEAKEKIRRGQYHELDSLNSVFHLTEIDTSFRIGNFVYLTFEGRFHPERLAELYKQVSSIDYAGASRLIGDWSNVYPWVTLNGLSYLFREGWGDCPAGCIQSCYWYFKVTSSGIDYIGSWCMTSGQPPGFEPDWWWEARIAYLYFRGGL